MLFRSDDLPFWTQVETRAGTSKPHLVVPYTLDTNDMRFAAAQGFNSGTQFFDYLRDAFDVHYAEGDERPSMMSIGMHCRLLGRPALSPGCRRNAARIPRRRSLGRSGTGRSCAWPRLVARPWRSPARDRKSTRLNSSH